MPGASLELCDPVRTRVAVGSHPVSAGEDARAHGRQRIHECRLGKPAVVARGVGAERAPGGAVPLRDVVGLWDAANATIAFTAPVSVDAPSACQRVPSHFAM